MSTEAKRAGNARYLAKMKTLTIRIKPEEYADLQAAAIEKEGGSVQGYILRAVRERMARDQAQAADAGQSSSTTEDTPAPTQDKP